MHKNPMNVQFNSVEEFLTELRQKTPNVEPIVRLTQQFENSGTLPLTHVSVIATYLRDTGGLVQLVRLRRYCGDYMVGDRDSKAEKKAHEAMEKIEACARNLGLEIRAGIYTTNEKGAP